MSDSTSGLRHRNSSGLWQALIKAAGLAVAFSLLGLFGAGVPVRARQLVTVLAEGDAVIFPGLPPTVAPVYTSRLGPAEAEALETLGLAPGLYAAYLLAFEIGLAVACAAVALTIFWRRSESWLTVWVSFVLVLLGTTATSPEIYTVTMTWDGWEMFPAAVGLLGIVSFLHLLFLAPDGQFVPRWSLRLAASWPCWFKVPRGRCPRPSRASWRLLRRGQWALPARYTVTGMSRARWSDSKSSGWPPGWPL
jgi:hypothetical protein